VNRPRKKKYKIKRVYTELGEFLQEQRFLSNLTQKEVSQSLGYSSGQFISNFERGISRPPLKKLAWMTKAYGIPPKVMAEKILESERKRIIAAIK
jgi:transcriptional regulator with XRE-family HTH domain